MAEKQGLFIFLVILSAFIIFMFIYSFPIYYLLLLLAFIFLLELIADYYHNELKPKTLKKNITAIAILLIVFVGISSLSAKTSFITNENGSFNYQYTLKPKIINGELFYMINTESISRGEGTLINGSIKLPQEDFIYFKRGNNLTSSMIFTVNYDSDTKPLYSVLRVYSDTDLISQDHKLIQTYNLTSVTQNTKIIDNVNKTTWNLNRVFTLSLTTDYLHFSLTTFLDMNYYNESIITQINSWIEITNNPLDKNDEWGTTTEMNLSLDAVIEADFLMYWVFMGIMIAIYVIIFITSYITQRLDIATKMLFLMFIIGGLILIITLPNAENLAPYIKDIIKVLKDSKNNCILGKLCGGLSLLIAFFQFIAIIFMIVIWVFSIGLGLYICYYFWMFLNNMISTSREYTSPIYNES